MVATKEKQIDVGEFKAKCSAVINEVAKRKRPITVTKHGKPLVRIVPIEDDDDMTRRPIPATA